MLTKQETEYTNGVVYSNPEHVQFVRDMKALGLRVEFREKFTYWGPSVTVPTSGKKRVLDGTKVSVGIEANRFDFIIFPVASDRSLRPGW